METSPCHLGTPPSPSSGFAADKTIFKMKMTKSENIPVQSTVYFWFAKSKRPKILITYLWECNHKTEINQTLNPKTGVLLNPYIRMAWESQGYPAVTDTLITNISNYGLVENSRFTSANLAPADSNNLTTASACGVCTAHIYWSIGYISRNDSMRPGRLQWLSSRPWDSQIPRDAGNSSLAWYALAYGEDLATRTLILYKLQRNAKALSFHGCLGKYILMNWGKNCIWLVDFKEGEPNVTFLKPCRSMWISHSMVWEF